MRKRGNGGRERERRKGRRVRDGAMEGMEEGKEGGRKGGIDQRKSMESGKTVAHAWTCRLQYKQTHLVLLKQ